MFEVLFIAVVLGGVVGAATAYRATHRRYHQVHFCEAEDLQEELERFKLKVAGNDRCLVCGEEISPDRIGMVVSRDGVFYEVCNSNRCMNLHDVAPVLNI